MSADTKYDAHHEAVTKLLFGIQAGLDKHAKTPNKDWGHVGDMEHIHKHLKNIHDMINHVGEYSKG